MATYNTDEAARIARFMIEYSKSKLPMQMLARGMSPSNDLCKQVRDGYERAVPEEIRRAVIRLEEAIQDGE